ncbi:MAG: 1-(5-phosphoribosyl)-5-[(5-phosphoribosylamino)methylideneamino]imidazole-4-carboxamide isomerase [Clostridia bacterium]|nr:1-(5-phosphoribosyl)-5-[(5-phosphoribosylamino)methylideneamino]imidazole-4-carboxamide isomerase [Clostridia bacterium]
MKIFPAIDIYDKKAVRLFKGDYANMTVYSNNPVEIALDFKNKGAHFMHVVDLEGAKTGETPNIEVIKTLVNAFDGFVEVGGGIRSMAVIERYLSAGVNRVILGTSAVTDREFLVSALETYKEKIAVGVDLKDGMVAIKGWTEKSALEGFAFCKELQELGVKTIICTDISKDGAMKGANHQLYKRLKNELSIDVIASGGVSNLSDVERLKEIDLYGAIIGKAYYTKAINLEQALQVAK